MSVLERKVSSRDGTNQKRGCTDVLCLIVLIVVVAAMGYCAFLGITIGDPYRLFFGVDSYGNTCNRNNSQVENSTLPPADLTGLKKVFYYDFSQLDNSIKVCVSACPNATVVTMGGLRNLENETGIHLCRYDVEPQDFTTDNNICPAAVLPQVSMFSRCLPEGAVDAVSSSVLGAVNGALSFLQAQCDAAGDFTEKAMNDIIATWQETLYMVAISFGVALVVTILMRFLAAIIVWVLVVGCSLGSAVASGVCWYMWITKKSQLMEDSEPEEKDRVQMWLICAGVASGVTVIIILIVLVMRKRIKLVVQLFNEAGKAVAKMPALLFQPFLTVLVLLIFLAGLLYIGLYIETADRATVGEDDIAEYKQDEQLKYLRWYYLFGALWVVNFVIACDQLVVAGAVCIWYFTRNKSKLGWPICKSLKRLLRYHLGSAAFGSFLIAVVQFARAVLAYMSSKLKKFDNKFVKFVLACLSCCLWCFEKFLKFINRNAYIMIAIHGYSFCYAAKDAFSLLLRNVLRVAAVNTVGSFVLFLGKLGIASIVVVIALEFYKSIELCFMWIPVALAGIIAYLIGHIFLSMYAMVIDTILLCFCHDVEENDGITKPFYMSKGLMKFISDAKKAEMKRSEKKAKKKASRDENNNNGLDDEGVNQPAMTSL